MGFLIGFVIGFMVAIALDVWEPALKEKEN